MTCFLESLIMNRWLRNLFFSFLFFSFLSYNCCNFRRLLIGLYFLEIQVCVLYFLNWIFSTPYSTNIVHSLHSCGFSMAVKVLTSSSYCRFIELCQLVSSIGVNTTLILSLFLLLVICKYWSIIHKKIITYFIIIQYFFYNYTAEYIHKMHFPN